MLPRLHWCASRHSQTDSEDMNKKKGNDKNARNIVRIFKKFLE